MCQCLFIPYPFAVIAVGYAFYAGRGRRYGWAAYSLIVLLWLLLVLDTADQPEIQNYALVGLPFLAVLAWYGWLKRTPRQPAVIAEVDP